MVDLKEKCGSGMDAIYFIHFALVVHLSNEA